MRVLIVPVVVLVVVLVLVVILGLWVAGVYNGLVRLRNLVREAWRQIDVELTRRHDLVPDLVEIVSRYAASERHALDSVVQARAAVVSSSMSMRQRAAAEGALASALGRLFAVVRVYPDLEVNQNYLALRAEITETEDRVAAGQRFYNASVRELNTRIESFLPSLFASVFHFERAECFGVGETGHQKVPAASSGSVAPLPVGRKRGDRVV